MGLDTDATGWQETCSRCKHLLRSGVDGNVWHCAAVRVGRNPAYAVTARAESWRKTAPARGKCGGTARLFEARTTQETPMANKGE